MHHTQCPKIVSVAFPMSQSAHWDLVQQSQFIYSHSSMLLPDSMPLNKRKRIMEEEDLEHHLVVVQQQHPSAPALAAVNLYYGASDVY